MVELKIKKVTLADLNTLSEFLINAGSSLNTFRYFKSRELSVISNHLITVLLYKGEIPVAYGHIDLYDTKFWLGIMVKESEFGLGYGKKLMTYLMDYCKNKGVPMITLSVDKDNIQAINLYNKYGFNVVGDGSNKVIFMQSSILK